MVDRPPLSEEPLRTTMARLAPGTALRDGLERILRGRTGGLVVLGHDAAVESICDGGFRLDVAFSATRLRELSKMDGAVIVSSDGGRILRANVQLVPDPTIPTEESGTRHRAAERTAAQTGHPVVSVSQSMATVSVYVAGRRHVLADSATILARADQALATLERYRSRLDEVTGQLTAYEVEGVVTRRDVLTVLQRTEMLRRIAAEIAADVVELGSDGRLVDLQLADLMGGSEAERALVVRDYLPEDLPGDVVGDVLADLDALDGPALLDHTRIARACRHPEAPEALDDPVRPRGLRMLARIPRLPASLAVRLVEHSRSIREGLLRVAESSAPGL